MNTPLERAVEVLNQDGRRIYSMLLRLTLREVAAEELFQDLFVKLLASPGFVTAANPAAYAQRVAMHLAFDWHRRRRRCGVTSLCQEPIDGSAQPVHLAMEHREQLDRVTVAINRLPLLSRKCIILRYLEERSYDAIAEMLNRTPHQTRALCHKGLVRLRELLTAGEEELIRDAI